VSGVDLLFDMQYGIISWCWDLIWRVWHPISLESANEASKDDIQWVTFSV